MDLLVDLGNSRLKWASHQNGQLCSVGCLKYDEENLATSISAAWSSLPAPGKIYVSSDVDSRLTAVLSQWVEKQWATVAHIITPKDHAYGVKNAYQDPLQLGTDRWAALVAVRNNIKGAAIIIDCGTAITIDVMNAKGEHLGGMIIPGIQMMQQSLFKGTHKINRTDEKNEPVLTALGKNTREGVRSGIHTAVIAFINETISRATRQTMPQTKTEKMTNVITGGDADVILPFLDNSVIHKPTLVLEGLAIILDKTQ